ncbi:MAG: AAA family ATPase, partial [Candidatus Poribacteria bacterium]|nr:AAA family ATPase [Candidatus Poribacteria bacterium]
MAIDRIVGRDEELRRMVDGLPTTPFEPGSTALISGSAGIGKTTLLRTFRALVMSGATHSFWIEGACSRQDKTSYGAFIDAFRRHLCRNPNTRTESVVEQVSAIVGGDAAMYLASLVDPHLAEWRIGMDPERLRHLTHDTIVEYLVRLSSSSPVVLVIEDIQWIDDVSMTLLKSLAFRCVDNALMIVATGRDAPEDGTLEFDEWCGWRVARRYIAVRLAELDFGLVRVLI